MPNGDKPGDAVTERARERFERMRREREKVLADLEDADWDETSEVVTQVAADAAARTAKQLSRPDIELDDTVPPDSALVDKKRGERIGRIVLAVLITVAAGAGLLIEALRRAGVLK